VQSVCRACAERVHAGPVRVRRQSPDLTTASLWADEAVDHGGAVPVLHRPAASKASLSR